MRLIRAEAIHGLNQNLQTLREGAGPDTPVLVSVLTFNEDVFEAFRLTPADEVPELTPDEYVHAPGTALLDAMGTAIVQTQADIDARLADQPGLDWAAVMLVITDGEENASTHYGQKEVRELVTAAEATGRWSVGMIGANFDVEGWGRSVGLSGTSVRPFEATGLGTQIALGGSSRAIATFLGRRRRGLPSTWGLFGEDASSEEDTE